MSAPTTKSGKTGEDRAVAFARAVAGKRLTSKEHCEECVRIAHDLARHGKPLPIEEVFVRKGYLKRPEAQTIARALVSWGHAAPVSIPITGKLSATGLAAKLAAAPAARPEPKLELAPERGAPAAGSRDSRRGRAAADPGAGGAEGPRARRRRRRADRARRGRARARPRPRARGSSPDRRPEGRQAGEPCRRQACMEDRA